MLKHYAFLPKPVLVTLEADEVVISYPEEADAKREKAAMSRTWAKREKQMETIVSSTAKFTGELQALYGPSLPELPEFQMPDEALQT